MPRSKYVGGDMILMSTDLSFDRIDSKNRPGRVFIFSEMKRQRPTKEGGQENKRRKTFCLNDDVWSIILRLHTQCVLWEQLRFRFLNYFMYDQTTLYDYVSTSCQTSAFKMFLNDKLNPYLHGTGYWDPQELHGIQIFAEAGGDRLVRRYGCLSRNASGILDFTAKVYNVVWIKPGYTVIDK